jgi:hypothetical protein
MRRYSPATALPPSQQALLEVCAQASEEVLARGVLLGAATAWLNNRCAAVQPLLSFTKVCLDSRAGMTPMKHTLL